MSIMVLCSAVLYLQVAGVSCFGGDDLPARIDAPHVPNAIRVHERVISGGLPEDDAAFQELKSLGVKTIISVDGAKPDVALAKKYGMRYVHLPHGYNGISDERALELAKAVRDLDGPIFIHCHHGEHRSPTAAAVACVTNGMVDSSVANKLLKLAGTSEKYLGLYQSAAKARRVDDQSLDRVKADFPEIAKLPPFAEAMVELEHTFDNLKRFSVNDWKRIEEHPDLDAAHEALLLLEHFKEMVRLESVAKEPVEFRRMLDQSEADARTLEALLRARTADGKILSTEVNASFKRLSDNCAACHKQFRDVPLGR